MIAYIEGRVLFSNGTESIIKTGGGIAYQIFYSKILLEDSMQALFVSHIFRENQQDLFGFSTFQEKKAFELLLTVKGVGPKTAYAITTDLGTKAICDAIDQGDEKAFKKVSGVGAKSAAQIILDLGGKGHKIKMYYPTTITIADVIAQGDKGASSVDKEVILTETILACESLGFARDKILPIAQALLKQNDVQKSEQLLHLVLKEI